MKIAPSLPLVTLLNVVLKMQLIGPCWGRYRRRNGGIASKSFLEETSDKATNALLAELPTAFNSTSCRARPLPDIARGAACLALTTPGIEARMKYPLDAEEHFLQIERALARWKQKAKHQPHRAAGFEGPWIENAWASHFGPLMYDTEKTGEAPKCLRDVFGPFVPILLPWVDRWFCNAKHYPPGLLVALKEVLRKDVLYITLAQNDIGLEGVFDLRREYPNILVLSAGGYGHVAVPLLKQEESPLSAETTPPRLPLPNRPLLASFTGDIGHSPGKFRGHMMQVLRHYTQQEAASKDSESSSLPTAQVTIYQGALWRSVMASSRAQLCPRGYGRTSYHVAEAIQMGLVPVHLYTDTPWVPYHDTVYPQLGYVAELANLSSLLDHLKAPASMAELEAKEAAAMKYSQSHFSLAGVMTQVARFMLDPGGMQSDLRCQPLPKDCRDELTPEQTWTSGLSGANDKKNDVRAESFLPQPNKQ